MLAAASMGATAFQKGLGGVHAIAHPVGAHFNTHHGLTNAIVLPYLIAHNRPAIEQRLQVIARTLDPSASGNPLPTDALTYERLFGSAVIGDLTLAG